MPRASPISTGSRKITTPSRPSSTSPPRRPPPAPPPYPRGPRPFLNVQRGGPPPPQRGSGPRRAALTPPNLRKSPPRLFHAGEIASPARGLYSALEHSSLPPNLHE